MSTDERLLLGYDGTDDAPLVGVVVRQGKPPEMIVTLEPDYHHNWMRIGWIANDGVIQVQD